MKRKNRTLSEVILILILICFVVDGEKLMVEYGFYFLVILLLQVE